MKNCEKVFHKDFRRSLLQTGLGRLFSVFLGTFFHWHHYILPTHANNNNNKIKSYPFRDLLETTLDRD